MMNPDLIEYRLTPHTSSKASKQIFPQGAVSIVVTGRGLIQHIENRRENLFGYSHKQLINMPFADLVASSDQALYLGTFLGADSDESEIRLTLCHANGCFFPARINARHFDTSTYSKQQTATGSWQKDHDEQSFKGRTEQRAHFGTWHLDSASQLLSLSHGIYEILALEGRPDLSVEQLLYYFGERQNRLRAALRRCLRQQSGVSLEARLVNKQQQHYWLKIYAEVELKDGKSVGLRGSVEDVSYRKRLQFKVSYLDACLNNVMRQSDDLILILDKRARVIAFNELYQKAFQSLFGISLNKGDQIEQLLSGFPMEQRIYQKLWGLMLYREQITMEMPLVQRHERLPVYQVNLRQIKNRQGQKMGVSFAAKLGQANKQGMYPDNYLARYDPLTGLYNHKEFQHQLTRRCLNASKNEGKHVLLYIDLSEFSRLNKQLGAEAGDTILKQCSQILKRQFRARDTLARLGADEFGVILENCDMDKAAAIAHQLRDSIRAAGFNWLGKRHPLDLQAGIVAITKDSDNAVSLLKLAKNTCLAAAGNNPPIRCYRFSRQSLSHIESNHFINIIKNALSSEGSVTLDYQPVRPINDWIAGEFVELFSRLIAPGKELVMPGQFLDTARRFSFMQDLDKKVLDEACRWLAGQKGKLLCSVNVSLESLRSEDFVPFVRTLVSQYKLPPSSLCLEISEVCCVDHADIVKQRCSALHEAGFKVLIDHVGRTRLDARYILDLDIDMIKLDGGLSRDTAKWPAKLLAIEYIVRIAALKGVKTIASQLESKESVNEAARLGIHFGQGFALALPQQLSSLQVA